MNLLSDVGIILADTGRSKVYLELLIKKELIPSKVIFLKNESERLPGQMDQVVDEVREVLEYKINLNFDVENAIKDLPSEVLISPTIEINSEEFKTFLVSQKENHWIYSGYGGVILREEILNTDKKFLHVHGGFLPEFKGSTCNFYSSLSDEFFGASSIFLEKEIDAGPLLMRKKYPVPKEEIDFDYIYESVCRADVLASTLEYFQQNKDWPIVNANQKEGRTFYIIHPLLKHLCLDRFGGLKDG